MSFSKAISKPMSNPMSRTMAAQAAATGPTVDDMLALSPDALFDATSAANLFQDTGRTTPVAATNDPIASITDLTTNARHLAVFGGTSTRRPLWTGEAARFDGTNDGLIVDWGAGGQKSQPYWEILSFQFLATTNSKIVLGAANLGDITFVWRNASGNLTMAAPIEQTIQSPADTSNHVLAVLFNGASSEAWLDGVEITLAGSPGTNTTQGVAWATQFLGSANANIDIYRHFKKAGALTADERALVEQWVDVKGVI